MAEQYERNELPDRLFTYYDEPLEYVFDLIIKRILAFGEIQAECFYYLMWVLAAFFSLQTQSMP